MKTKKNRKLKGGTPRILKITGYYDSDDIDKRQLIDFRVEKVKDKEAAEKYWEKHKVSIDPAKGLLEEVLDLFNFNQAYTNKAEKRVDAFLSKPDPDKNPKTETRYVIVNDKDDIDKIKITNDLIRRLASMKQQGKISGGAGEEEEKKLSEPEKTDINKLKEQLMNEFKTEKDKDGISAIVNSPGFTRILGEYVKIDKSKLPLDKNALTYLSGKILPTASANNDLDKLDKVLAIVTQLAENFETLKTNVETLNTQVNGMVTAIDTKIDTKLQSLIEKAAKDVKENSENFIENAEISKSSVTNDITNVLKSDDSIALDNATSEDTVNITEDTESNRISEEAAAKEAKGMEAADTEAKIIETAAKEESKRIAETEADELRQRMINIANNEKTLKNKIPQKRFQEKIADTVINYANEVKAKKQKKEDEKPTNETTTTSNNLVTNDILNTENKKGYKFIKDNIKNPINRAKTRVKEQILSKMGDEVLREINQTNKGGKNKTNKRNKTQRRKKRNTKRV